MYKFGLFYPEIFGLFYGISAGRNIFGSTFNFNKLTAQTFNFFLNSRTNIEYFDNGTELPGKAGDRAGQIAGLTLKVGDLSETDFAGDYFDAVCIWHVFEHLAQPKQTLRIIGGLLRPGGYLFLSLPNIESVQSRLFRGNWLHLDPPRHLFFLGPADLTVEMRKLGFAAVARRHLSIEQNVFGFQQSILNCLMGRRDVLFEALKGNLEYAGKYSRWHILVQKAFWLSTFGLFAGLAALEAAVRRGGTIEFVFRKNQR